MSMRSKYLGLSRVLILAGIILTGCNTSGPVTIGGEDSKNSGRYNAIAAIKDVVCLAYYDSGNKDLKFTRSLDSGLTWPPETTRTVDAKGTVGHYAAIALSGRDVFISYYDIGNACLKFAKSMDGGKTWNPGNIRIIDPEKKTGKFNAISVSGNHVYISYCASKKNELRVAVSKDRGESWNVSDIRIIDNAAVSKGGRYTSIVAQGDDVYVSYNGAYSGRGKGKSLKFAKSTDRGKTWAPDNIRVIEGPECSLGMYTSMAVQGNNIYISYAGKKVLKCAISRDRGATWLPKDIRIIDRSDKRRQIGFTSIAAQGNDIFISYAHSGSLKLAQSKDGGKTWNLDHIWRTEDNNNAKKKGKRKKTKNPATSIAISDSNVYLSFYDNQEGLLKFMRSKDRGKTWN